MSKRKATTAKAKPKKSERKQDYRYSDRAAESTSVTIRRSSSGNNGGLAVLVNGSLQYA